MSKSLKITRSAFVQASFNERMARIRITSYNVCYTKLLRDESDVQKIADTANCATALIYDPPQNFEPETDRVKFAFDADADCYMFLLLRILYRYFFHY